MSLFRTLVAPLFVVTSLTGCVFELASERLEATETTGGDSAGATTSSTTTGDDGDRPDASTSSGESSSSGSDSSEGGSSTGDGADENFVPTCEPLEFIAGEVVAYRAGDVSEDAEAPDNLILEIRASMTCEAALQSTACEEERVYFIIAPEAQAVGTYDVGLTLDGDGVSGWYEQRAPDIGQGCLGVTQFTLEGTLEILAISDDEIHVRLCGTSTASIDLEGDVVASICSY